MHIVLNNSKAESTGVGQIIIMQSKFNNYIRRSCLSYKKRDHFYNNNINDIKIDHGRAALIFLNLANELNLVSNQH